MAGGAELEVGYRIIDPENGRRNGLSDVNRAIWKTLQKHQIEVPFPQRGVRLIVVGNSGQGNISALHDASDARLQRTIWTESSA